MVSSVLSGPWAPRRGRLEFYGRSGYVIRRRPLSDISGFGKRCIMEDWIPFEEGEYLAERAFLASREESAASLERVVVRVFSDKMGRRQMDGRGRVRNVHMVELLEESDDLDLLLDMGEEFKYILRNPVLKAGKVFSPDVRSVFHFIPRGPWEQIGESEFESLCSRLTILSD